MSRPQSRRVRYAWLAAAAVAVAAAGVPVPSPALRGVSLQLGDGQHLEIGAVRARASLIGAALAQAAESVTLENVTLDLGFAVYKAPKVAFSGVSLSRAELLSLLDTTTTEPLAPRLARLSAKEILAPELTVEQQMGDARNVTRYRNVSARDVVQGRLTALTSDGAAFELTSNEGPAKGSIGRMSVADFDLAETARVFAEKAGAAPSPLKRIYGAFSLENLSLATGKGGEARIARMAGRDFSARPTRDSWPETVKALGTVRSGPDASPADKSRALALTLDLIDGFEVGAMEATGIEVLGPDGKDKATGRIARIAYTSEGQGSRPSEARIEGMDFDGADARVRIGTIAFSGFSFRSTLEGLRRLGDKDVAKLDPTEARTLIPTIGTIRFSGLDVEIPDRHPKGLKPDNQRYGIKEIEFTADKPLNGVPTNLRFGVDGITFTVPPGAKEDGLRELGELGYRAVDVSSVVAASWNESGNELLLREVSFRGAEMGTLTLRGTLGNLTKDVFSPDTTVALVSLVGATAKTLDLTVENKGLFDRVMAMQAREQKRSPDDLRKEYGMAAAVGIPAMLGNSGAAKALGQAIARFIAKPGRLSISARAKDSAGLGLADLASLAEPATIFDKLEVTATAE